MTNVPSSFVVADFSSFVAVSTKVTLTPGTIASLVSFTTPLTRVVTLCPETLNARQKMLSTRLKMLTGSLNLIIMGSFCGWLRRYQSLLTATEPRLLYRFFNFRKGRDCLESRRFVRNYVRNMRAVCELRRQLILCGVLGSLSPNNQPNIGKFGSLYNFVNSVT